MTRRLARLADIAYRRRGRMVLAWIVADRRPDHRPRLLPRRRVRRRLQHARLGVEGGERPDRTRIRRLLGAGNLRRLEGPAGRRRARRRSSRWTPSSPRPKRSSTSSRRDAIRVSDDGTIATTTLPLNVPGWEVKKEQGEELIAAAEANSGGGLEIKLGGEPIYAAQEQTSPEGLGFLGAAIVLLIAFGSLVAAGLPLVDRPGRPRHLLGRPDRAARQRDRRPQLDHGGLGPDRDRRRDRLRAARPDPLPRGDAGRQGPPRRGRRGGHHRRAQRDHRRLHRRRSPSSASSSPACPTCTGWRSRPRWRCWS